MLLLQLMDLAKTRLDFMETMPDLSTVPGLLHPVDQEKPEGAPPGLGRRRQTHCAVGGQAAVAHEKAPTRKRMHA